MADEDFLRERKHTPDTFTEPAPGEPHDHKGYSEEQCIRCGWMMGDRPLNCQNDDTPHVFPSQQDTIRQLQRQIAERIDYQAIDHIVGSVKDVLDAARRQYDTQLLQADLIRLKDAEIEMLNRTGNVLAEAYRTLGGLDVAYDDCLRKWEEVKRG